MEHHSTEEARLAAAPKAMQFAALDLGSNSFHLVVARVIDQHLQPLLRFKQRVQLADGLGKGQRLSEAAIERGLAALELCAQRLVGFAPEQVHIVATHTFREAKNADAFLARATAILPFPINIISGHEEARLIYRGVAETSAYQGKRVVIDIGGGSTEIAAGEAVEAKLLSSSAMGCVSFSNRFFKDGKLSEKRFNQAMIAARSELEAVAGGLRKFAAVQCIGTSGTIKAIGLWVQNGADSATNTFTREQLRTCVAELLQHKHMATFAPAGIDADRKALLPAGLAILLAVLDELNIDQVVVHDAALREGVLYELAGRIMHQEDVRQRTIDAMVARYHIDGEQAQRVASTAQRLLAATTEEWRLAADEWQQRLTWGAWLHEVGLHINSSGIQNHSRYIVAHADMPGFGKEEQAFLAALVGSFRKKLRIEQIPLLQLFEQRDLYRLIAILRLAVLFNTDRQPSLLLKRLQVSKDMLLLILTPEGYQNPMLMADLSAEVKQQAKLGINLRFYE